jgi:hypothetical protein
MKGWHHQFRSSEWARKLEPNTQFCSTLPCKWRNMTDFRSILKCSPPCPLKSILIELIQNHTILQTHPVKLSKREFEYWPWSYRSSGEQCFLIIMSSSDLMKTKDDPFKPKVTDVFRGWNPAIPCLAASDWQVVFELSDAWLSLSVLLLTLQLCLYFEKGQKTKCIFWPIFLFSHQWSYPSVPMRTILLYWGQVKNSETSLISTSILFLLGDHYNL